MCRRERELETTDGDPFLFCLYSPQKEMLIKSYSTQGFRRLESSCPSRYDPTPRWDPEYKRVDKHARSLSTQLAKVAPARCEALLQLRRCSLPASTVASKQAGQVLLRLDRHQGLICVYSPQHLQHKPAGNHGDGL